MLATKKKTKSLILKIVRLENSLAYFTTPKPKHKQSTMTLAKPTLIILKTLEKLNNRKFVVPYILMNQQFAKMKIDSRADIVSWNKMK